MGEDTKKDRTRAPAQDVDLCWLFRDSAAACGQSSIQEALEAMSLSGPGRGSANPYSNRLVSRGVISGVGPKDRRESPVGRQRRIMGFLAACTAEQVRVLELAYGQPKSEDAEARAKLGPWPDVAYRTGVARQAFDAYAPRGRADGTRAGKIEERARRPEPLHNIGLGERKAWSKEMPSDSIQAWKEPEVTRMDFQRWLREEASPRTLSLVRVRAAEMVLAAWMPFDAARGAWVAERRARRAREDEDAGRARYAPRASATEPGPMRPEEP